MKSTGCEAARLDLVRRPGGNILQDVLSSGGFGFSLYINIENIYSNILPTTVIINKNCKNIDNIFTGLDFGDTSPYPVDEKVVTVKYIRFKNLSCLSSSIVNPLK